MKIFKEIISSLQDDLPFVVYRKPNAEKVKSFFQEDDMLHLTKDFNASGFVFAPFDNSKPSILIPEKKSKVIHELVAISDRPFLAKQTMRNYDRIAKENHVQLVERGVNAICGHQFKKVVLSRREKLDINDFDALVAFKKILLSYPNAFCYIWYHPKVGLWMGATPETLLEIDDKKFTTMSLAGTQLYDESIRNITWGGKEIEEQQLVTDYIIDSLRKESEYLTIEEKETFKIGKLLHLRTRISGTISSTVANIIKILHPTPAVCGFPMNASKLFIHENEGYDRSFYTGFLGELNLREEEHDKSSLYVNLRCMQVVNNKVYVYVGGGITKDSDPEKEWEETLIKSEAMKKVL